MVPIEELFRKAVEFHGHECPGLAIGVRASQIVMEEFQFGKADDEELVCVTENDSCGVDGIQAVLGCTMGKGNLIYRATGKQAYSFYLRNCGRQLRLLAKPAPYVMSREERKIFLLEAPKEEIFIFSQPSYPLPEKAKNFQTVICELCGEGAPEHKIRLQGGRKVCLDCFHPYDRIFEL